MTQSMRALTLATGRTRIVDLPVPTPVSGQVLVEIKVSAVNEMDVQVRSGGWTSQVRRFRQAGPVVTGFEFSGVARSDGGHIRSGDRVIGYVHVLNGPRTHAEFVCVSAKDLQVIPSDLTDEDAAALVVTGLTAVETLERLKPLSAGHRCLVIGAAGGVGVYSVQLARSQGAHVTGVCAAGSQDWIIEQGAASVRDRAAPFVPGDQFDLVIDAPARASFREAEPFLAPGGMYVSTNPTADPMGFLRAAVSSRRAGWLMMLTTTPAKLSRLVELNACGAIRPAIDSVFDLADAEAAFDRFATPGKRGRVLLRVAA